MIDRFIKLLSGELEPADNESGPFERRFIAAAVLLVEASQFDVSHTPADRERIVGILASMFHFRPEVAAQVLSIAEERFANTLDDWVFAEAVRKGFSAAEREELLTMLWELVYHDGELLRLESQMMAKLGDELGLSAEAVENARTLALARSVQMGDRQSEV